ncbi:aspartyl-phosphate phosphatase Spo0E family protein [Bacillus sp. ISL-78]|uniref:aspartyl-phosphate phosphatase Spo0E family protein n=1 Tax=Bacillus sp. ISL-101 TaxID=2819117 RepID=UPI001BE70633|nr:aspartyl-phosphate phosphatase Spo0E family protein [Bacillus sp. ISL-101]MBT2614006.1 aspartyl-phosphate phosphatase Spo0E family protein [Bacillus sp. ISL-78]MBT2629483.1 aspartyl-phosphate phosphatase Spo0E family protein [Bacillus sp. ISL-101]MBT2718421.1 aspartyl-phosphate phosphatase Spo0E family protein [Bacillus sp. ISL-57]
MCNFKSQTELLDLKIKFLRKKLVQCGVNNGFTHWETLKYSQRLDKLIFKSLLKSK